VTEKTLPNASLGVNRNHLACQLQRELEIREGWGPRGDRARGGGRWAGWEGSGAVLSLGLGCLHKQGESGLGGRVWLV
jgi:hypothetical protein